MMMQQQVCVSQCFDACNGLKTSRVRDDDGNDPSKKVQLFKGDQGWLAPKHCMKNVEKAYNPIYLSAISVQD